MRKKTTQKQITEIKLLILQIHAIFYFNFYVTDDNLFFLRHFFSGGSSIQTQTYQKCTAASNTHNLTHIHTL